MENRENYMKELRVDYERARERFYSEFNKIDAQANPYIKKLYVRHGETDEMFQALLNQSSIFRDGD
jgi:hypothetical protein